MAGGTSQETWLLKPPDTIYRRITPGNWSLHGGDLVVRPSNGQFVPHSKDGLLSVGVHSLIVAEGLTPQEAMLWGSWKGFGLVSIDLQVIHDAGLAVHHDPKPLPPDGEGPWHANVHGIPFAAKNPDKKRRHELQDLFRKKAVWLKPTHDELKDQGFEKRQGDIEELQARVSSASAINEWKKFIVAVTTAAPPQAQTFIDAAQRAIDELEV